MNAEILEIAFRALADMPLKCAEWLDMDDDSLSELFDEVNARANLSDKEAINIFRKKFDKNFKQ